MPADHLGQAFYHIGRAQLQRLHQLRRRERVVYYQGALPLPTNLGHSLDVHQSNKGIGHGFNEEQLGGLSQGIADRIQVGGIDKRGLDAEARQLLLEKDGGSTIERGAGHDPIPLLDERQNRGADGRHARGAYRRPGSSLDSSYLLGQMTGIWMAIARVEE